MAVTARIVSVTAENLAGFLPTFQLPTSFTFISGVNCVRDMFGTRLPLVENTQADFLIYLQTLLLK